LSERQKNEAPLDLPSDHPLRKLISRFRRRSERNLLSPFANHGADPEVGLSDEASRHTTPSKEQTLATSNDDAISHLSDVTRMTPSYTIALYLLYLLTLYDVMSHLYDVITSYLHGVISLYSVRYIPRV